MEVCCRSFIAFSLAEFWTKKKQWPPNTSSFSVEICRVFVLEQKRKKKSAWKSAAEAVSLSRSEFKLQYEQNSEHKSSWLWLLMVLLGKRKKSMILSDKTVEQKKRSKKRKPFGSLLQKLYCFLASRILNKKTDDHRILPVFLLRYAEYLF